MSNKNIIKMLNNISNLLLIKGEIPFKSQAYRTAADIIEVQNLDLESLVKENKLSDVDGFGKALVEKISDFVNNGEMAYYKKLTSEIPETLLELLEVDGLGTKRISKLWKKLNVKSKADLIKVVNDGTINDIDGFGKKMIENLKTNLI